MAVGRNAELREEGEQRAPPPRDQKYHDHGEANHSAIEPREMREQWQEQEANDIGAYEPVGSSAHSVDWRERLAGLAGSVRARGDADQECRERCGERGRTRS